MSIEGTPSRDQKARKVGQQQSLYREVNERITDLAATFDVVEQMEILCECGLDACVERITLSAGDYERLRSMPTHFAVLAGHELADFERVVEVRDGYVVVEKVGDSAVVA